MATVNNNRMTRHDGDENMKVSKQSEPQQSHGDNESQTTGRATNKGGQNQFDEGGNEERDLAGSSNINDNNKQTQQESTSTAVDKNSETVKGPRQVIKQAARDVQRGLRDTERRGVPSDVPTNQGDENQSKGSQVPPGGVNRTR